MKGLVLQFFLAFVPFELLSLSIKDRLSERNVPTICKIMLLFPEEGIYWFMLTRS